MDFCYWQPNKIDKKEKNKSQEKFENISNWIKMLIHKNLWDTANSHREFLVLIVDIRKNVSDQWSKIPFKKLEKDSLVKQKWGQK